LSVSGTRTRSEARSTPPIHSILSERRASTRGGWPIYALVGRRAVWPSHAMTLSSHRPNGAPRARTRCRRARRFLQVLKTDYSAFSTSRPWPLS
jgi:hypothetical protein